MEIYIKEEKIETYESQRKNILDEDEFLAYYLKHNLNNQYMYDDLYYSCNMNRNNYSSILTDIHNKLMNVEIPYNIWVVFTNIVLISFFLTVCGKSSIDEFIFDYSGLNTSIKILFNVLFGASILFYIFYIRNVKRIMHTLYNFYRYVEHLKLQKIIKDKK